MAKPVGKERQPFFFQQRASKHTFIMKRKIKLTKYYTNPINYYSIQMFVLVVFDMRQWQILRWLAYMLLYHN